MKVFNKVSVVVLATLLTLGLAGIIAVRAFSNPTPVDLGGADSFVILAGTPNITDVANSSSILTGDVGLSPATSGGMDDLICSQIGTGTIYGVDQQPGTGTAYVGDGIDTSCFIGTPAGKTFVDDAKLALTAAYIDVAGRPVDSTVATELGGTTKFAGVYNSDSTTFGITAGAGPLILDGEGNPDAIFIFEMASGATGLTVGNASQVQLINQAQACNVYWRVTTASIGTTAVFKGNILALTSITVADGAIIEGRLLARNGSVTLDNDDITLPTCTSAATLNVIKVVGGGNADPSDFNIYVKEGGVNVTGSPATGLGGLGTAYSLSAGTYVVSEDVDDSYDVSFSGDCDANGSITLVADTDYTCTITNNFNQQLSSGGGRGSVSAPATLHVIKQVVNNNGGTLTASAFNLHVKNAGVDVAGSPTIGTAIPGTSYTLSAGTYIVSEDATNGSYVRSFSGDCDSSGSVTLSSGDNETCTITNDDIDPGVAPTVALTLAPGLPNTGIGPDGRSNVPWNIIIPTGIFVILFSFYLARKKWAL